MTYVSVKLKDNLKMKENRKTKVQGFILFINPTSSGCPKVDRRLLPLQSQKLNKLFEPRDVQENSIRERLFSTS